MAARQTFFIVYKIIFPQKKSPGYGPDGTFSTGCYDTILDDCVIYIYKCISFLIALTVVFQ